jgi:hypothetical protein
MEPNKKMLSILGKAIVDMEMVMELKARTSKPAIAVGFTAATCEESGEGVEWQRVTRRKAKTRMGKSTVTRVRSGAIKMHEGSQQTAPDFEAASTV